MSKRYPMPPGRYEEVMERDGWMCQAHAYGMTGPCNGRPIVHHRRARGSGGTKDPTIHDADNLVVLCDQHHLDVHANPAQSYENGLSIRRNAHHG